MPNLQWGMLQILWWRSHFGIRIEYWMCDDCTLVAQSPRMSDSFLPEFYRLHYRRLYYSESPDVFDEFELGQLRGQNILDIYSQTVQKTNLGTILDIGCASGGLLSIAKSQFGAERLLGVEPDENQAKFAQQRSVEVFGSLEDIPDNCAHVVTSSHVLEHVANISDHIEAISRILVNGGDLCIEVPHAVEGACFQIAHLWGFNEASLTRLLVNYGFEVRYMTTHGIPRHPERKFLYLLVIAQKRNNFTQKILQTQPFHERRKMWTLKKEKAGQKKSYMRYVIKNSIKQILGKTRGQFVAHSFFPTSHSALYNEIEM